jgi:anti-anti-sigma factor
VRADLFGCEGTTHSLQLYGELDLAGVPALEAELRGVEETDADQIIVDLSALPFIDSGGCRLLLEAEARSRADGRRLRLVRGTNQVERVLEIVGVFGALPYLD